METKDIKLVHIGKFILWLFNRRAMKFGMFP